MLQESRDALQGVRRALIELYASVGADPRVPQEVARQLGLNRNLTWKLSRVISAPEPFSILNHMPGQQGLELATAAFEKAGASAATLDNVRSAMASFNDVVARHVGDRDLLELSLESRGVFKRETGVESGRELAFRGNSMIWGVQARVRLMLAIIAPGKPDTQGAPTVDFVVVSAWIGFRRLRPEARWRLFRMQVLDDSGAAMPGANGQEELEPKANGEVPFVIREFCSPNLPEIESIRQTGGLDYMLPGGAVGNLGAFDCVTGYVVRGLPTRKSPGNEWGSVAAVITPPVEWLVFDLLTHRDAALAQAPELLVYGFPHGGADSPDAQSISNQLPISADLVELPGMPPAVATPLVPRYNQLINRIYQRLGWDAQHFRGARVQMPYPPMSSRVILRWPLE